MLRSRLGSLACCVLFLCACAEDVKPGAAGDSDPGSGASGSGASGGGGSGSGAAGTGAAGGGGAGSGGAPFECQVPVAVAGTYFLSVATELAPKTPFVFLQTITEDATGLSFSLQPLRADDRKTPVGTPTNGSLLVGPDGALEMDVADASIPGDANTITATDLVADMQLSSAPCPATFCGEVSGGLSEPIAYRFSKATFRAEPVTGDSYPEPPPIDCFGSLADPL